MLLIWKGPRNWGWIDAAYTLWFLFVFVLVCDSIGILKLGALWNTGARKFHIVFHGLLCGCCLNGFTSVEGAFCVFHWIGKRKGPWGRTSFQQYCMQCSLLACSLTSGWRVRHLQIGVSISTCFFCGLCDWNVLQVAVPTVDGRNRANGCENTWK